MMVASIMSLLDTTYPFELIVIDNGNSEADTQFFLDLVKAGKINTYVRNANNMHFGYARSQGLELAQGDYICIADNDILYKDPEWLSKCIKVLEYKPKNKWYATPVDYPMPGDKMDIRYRTGSFNFNGETYTLNMRAGSNCMVVRRRDFKVIGKFVPHIISGSKWATEAVKKGYLAVVLPSGCVEDMGIRRGYNLSQVVPIKIDLSDGESVHFNRDSYGEDGSVYRTRQRSFYK
jgi:glycosyltransferase involved in cell wall biosynthesis